MKNFEDLQNAIRIFYPSILLDAVCARRTRRMMIVILDGAVSFFFVLWVISITLPFLTGLSGDMERISLMWQALGPSVFLGALLFSVGSWMLLRAIEAFYDSYYFVGTATILPEEGLADSKPTVTFEAGSVVYAMSRAEDSTVGFCQSSLGRRALLRVGIGQKALQAFFSSRGNVSASLKTLSLKSIVAGMPVGLADIARATVAHDDAFAKFLTRSQITSKDMAGSADWIEHTEVYVRKHDRFWSKDSLGRIKSIGKDWAYGVAPALERFAHDITETGNMTEAPLQAHLSELNELEAILARSAESNALLIADDGDGGMDIVRALGARIKQGSVLPPLEHKRIFLFDSNSFVAGMKDKSSFEHGLLHMLNEAVNAGNIIFVVKDFPEFLRSARAVGADLISLLDSYLTSPQFQMIAFSDPSAYHNELERDSKISHRFERILVKDYDEEVILRLLEDQALVYESTSRLFFTFQSLSAIADGAKRYFSDQVASDKALHLLAEVVPFMQSKRQQLVHREDVLALIESKTGIPTGGVTGEEREKLLNLESILHNRIIGQDEAIEAISNAMRRSRSDIENPEKPMGSFLFLGPTGVGKTETTKALAATFFGKEEAIIRLDMSEYRTDDALKRLIGSFEDGKVGVLSSKLRTQPYGVLLLDEFEKTNKEVLDLFLQILDEGFFSDMSGKRVNARNLIIIATSNAGSDLIWNLMRDGKDITGQKDNIIAEIINRGIFKPELLNRFDGTILFHPLTPENLKVIAGLMLQKLQKRLAERGIELVINDALRNAVVSAGTDPEFGARPMNRAIVEKVEQVIAKKIIAGDAPAGSRIELTAEELA